MAAGIFQSTNASSKVSSGTLLNPVIFRFNNAGGIEEKRLFLRHDILAGAGAESSTDVTIQPLDIATGTDDVDSWIQIAPDASGSPGTYGAGGAAVNLGNVNVGQTTPFWVKATVPSNNEVGGRDDLVLNLASASSASLSKTVDISIGTYSGSLSYDLANNNIKFAWANPGDSGEFLSPWINISTATAINGVSYTETAPSASVFVDYRTATDSSGTNPTAWFSNPADLDLSKDYLQIKLRTYSEFQTNYQASTDFSTLGQGVKQWRYQWANVGSFSYSDMGFVISGYWSKSSTTPPFCQVTSTGHHPDVEDSVRTWISPFNGTATLTCNGNVRKSNNTGDGVIARIYKNTSSAAIWDSGVITNTTGLAQPTFNVSVVEGDAIRYRVNQNVNNSNDSMLWDPIIKIAPTKTISNLKINYSGPVSINFDMRFWIGPATPALISPADGFTTEEFNPPLTAVTANGDNIQFQLDMLSTFDGPNLTTWEAACTNDTNVTSQSPVFDRPPGVWYWRARAKLNGVYGNWTDYRTLTILPFIGYRQYLYINVNGGVEILDPLVTLRHIYINVNSGIEPDTLATLRHDYINVNIQGSIGEVIYPLFDKTLTRKESFPEDGSAFI